MTKQSKTVSVTIRMPLAQYRRAKAKADQARVTVSEFIRRSVDGPDKMALAAQALALIGKAEIWRSLAELVRLARNGSLPLTPEVEAALLGAFRDIQKIKEALLQTLGFRQ